MNIDKTKKVIRTTGSILSTLFLICSVALCIYVFVVNYMCSQNGEEPFYFGYRPCMIQTGSMEPYMMTNGIILTKEVDSIDDVQVGDVVTYTAQNDARETIYITHRITDISEDGYITTKGDNNRVDDGFLLTMDNIIAKEVGVFNQPSVWLINTWEGGIAGKALIVCICLAIILFFFSISTLISGWLNDDEITEGDLREYTKLCRKLGFSPANTFQGDIDRLYTLLDLQKTSDQLLPVEVETGPEEEAAAASEHEPDILTPLQSTAVQSDDVESVNLPEEKFES